MNTQVIWAVFFSLTLSLWLFLYCLIAWILFLKWNLLVHWIIQSVKLKLFSLIYRTYISIYGYNTCESFYYYQARFAVLVTWIINYNHVLQQNFSKYFSMQCRNNHNSTCNDYWQCSTSISIISIFYKYEGEWLTDVLLKHHFNLAWAVNTFCIFIRNQ